MARILVIDDEEPIRSIMRRSLKPHGHEVTEASDGRIGIQLFQTSSFDLVITDLFMPDQEGIETILELREKDPAVKILVVSGGLPSGGQSLEKFSPLADAEALGADASLAKPFQIHKLVDVVNGLLSDP